MKQAAPSLRNLHKLRTEWMNGIQFYLRPDVPVVRGHVLYADSGWALTSVSQLQFWKADLRDYGDGKVEGVLSVDISDWGTESRPGGKKARECTPEEIR